MTSVGERNDDNGAYDYDLAIVGSGSAAFAAAIRARAYGASVLMVEADTIGGTCVNTGCVPSKFVLRAAELYHEASANRSFGLSAAHQHVNLPVLLDQKAELVGELRRGKYEDLVEHYGLTLRKGTGRFAERDTLLIDEEPVRARAYLIATGAVPRVPSIPGLEHAGYLTSTSALEAREMPRSLAVIGGNAIGLELGQYFARLGSRVVILEAMDRITPFEEPEISDALTVELAKEGIEVLAGVRVAAVSVRGGHKRLSLFRGQGEELLDVDEILIATGRKPNTEHLSLDRAGVRTATDGAIIVNDNLRTTNPRVYAAGDVTGAPQFVYVAGYHGSLAADNAVGKKQRDVDLEALPRVIFTSPQMAAVGLTQHEAEERGFDVKISMLPIAQAVPRAIVNGSGGVLKLVAESSEQRILGVHMVGDNAGEVIQAATLAVKFRLTVQDLLDTFHPYLTMAEGLKLAAQTFDRDVASLSCCAS